MTLGNQVKEYLDKPYNIVVCLNDGEGCSGFVAEFPGCHACGDTPEKTLQETLRMMEGWITASLQLGHSIPEPFDVVEMISLARSKLLKCEKK
jgi:predicted RNase H-like HicB family nuclease